MSGIRLFGIVVLLAWPALACADSPFFGRSEEGWFWYETMAEPPAAAEPDAMPVQMAEPVAPPARSAAPSPAPLSAAWFRENLDRYRDRAIDDPTPDNVRAYLLLQKVMMDKASDFTAATQMVTLGDPLLDATVERPLATYAVHAADRTTYLARQRVLQDLAQYSGLMFFFRSDCPYCKAMAPVVENLGRRVGFPVVAVSVDGRPMPDGRFPDYRVDAGQAARLGVQTVPALFLVRPPAQIEPLAQGAMALEALEDRILMKARQAGWITEDVYDTTLAIRRTTRVPDLATVDAAAFDDSGQLVDLLRSAMPNGGGRR